MRFTLVRVADYSDKACHKVTKTRDAAVCRVRNLAALCGIVARPSANSSKTIPASPKYKSAKTATHHVKHPGSRRRAHSHQTPQRRHRELPSVQHAPQVPEPPGRRLGNGGISYFSLKDPNRPMMRCHI